MLTILGYYVYKVVFQFISKLFLDLIRNMTLGTFALLALVFNHGAVGGLTVTSGNLVGNVSCDLLRTSSPANLTFAAEGKVGGKYLYGSYNIHGNNSLESIGELSNIEKFDAPLDSYVLSYKGEVVNCIPGSSFNSTITGSCGKNMSVQLIQELSLDFFQVM